MTSLYIATYPNITNVFGQIFNSYGYTVYPEEDGVHDTTVMT